jgi:hypothetical protein
MQNATSGGKRCGTTYIYVIRRQRVKEPAEPVRRKVCLQVCSGPCEKVKILATPGWNVTVTP